MVLYALLISTSFTVGAGITEYLPPQMLTCLRFAEATVVFAVVVAIRGELRRPPLRSLLGYAVLASLLSFYFISMFEALRHTSAMRTGALFALVPMMSAGWAWIFLRARLSRRALAFMVVGGLGAAWIVLDGGTRVGSLGFGRGEWIFLGGAVAFAAYPPLVRHFHRGESIAVMNLWTLAVGTVLLVVVSAPDIVAVDWRNLPVSVHAGVAWLAVFTTGVTFFIAKFASTVLPPAKVMSYTYLTPVFVMLTDAVVRQAAPPATLVAGALVTATATVLLQRA